MKKQLSTGLVALVFLGILVYFVSQPSDETPEQDHRQEIAELVSKNGNPRENIEPNSKQKDLIALSQLTKEIGRAPKITTRRKVSKSPIVRPGVPQFLNGPVEGDPLEIALNYIRKPENHTHES